MISLSIGIKKGIARIHDPDAEAKNMEYVSARAEVLRRDKWTCQGCGFVSKGNLKKEPNTLEFSGFLEVHHLDNNHGNNSAGNLATVCPFCHEIFHAGIAGRLDRCIPIVLPEFSHAVLNRWCHVLFSVIERAQNSSDVVYAKRLYKELEDRNQLLPVSLQSQESLGNALAALSMDEYKQRERYLAGIRLLPRRDAFSRYVQYYNETSWADIGKDWSKYKSAIVSALKKGN